MPKTKQKIILNFKRQLLFCTIKNKREICGRYKKVIGLKLKIDKVGRRSSIAVVVERVLERITGSGTTVRRTD